MRMLSMRLKALSTRLIRISPENTSKANLNGLQNKFFFSSLYVAYPEKL
jgi:hypothetical protein